MVESETTEREPGADDGDERDDRTVTCKGCGQVFELDPSTLQLLAILNRALERRPGNVPLTPAEMPCPPCRKAAMDRSEYMAEFRERRRRAPKTPPAGPTRKDLE